MAFMPAERSRILLGSLNLSCYATQIGATAATAMLETTTLCNTSKVFIPGQTEGSFDVSGHLDTDGSQGAQFDTFADWKQASPLPVTYAPSGLTALSEALLAGALEGSFTPSAPVGAVVDFSLSSTVDGAVEAGFVLEDLTAVTADGNGTARDLTAQSTNGAVAHLHVTAFSGLTNNIVTIEDSADGSTNWTTIGTFATVTGLTSERLVIAGTVRRYLRVVDNVTGTGTNTRSVALARR
jgi:hypothetical protein